MLFLLRLCLCLVPGRHVATCSSYSFGEDTTEGRRARALLCSKKQIFQAPLKTPPSYGS